MTGPIAFFFFFFFALSSANPPHFVVIIGDDVGFNDVGWQGNSRMPTPVMDSLASEGAIFKQHYAQPVCTATRSALMTGRYPIRTGRQHYVTRPSYPVGLDLNEKLLSEYLKEEGYATHLVGKWHLGFADERYVPTARGFDSFYGTYQGTCHHYQHVRSFNRTNGNVYDCLDEPQLKVDEVLTGLCMHQDKPNDLKGSKRRLGQWSSDCFEEESREILDKHDPNTPLYLHLAFTAPHTPLLFDQRYAAACTENGKNLYANPSRMEFCTLMAGMDKAIGGVVEKLKEKKMYDNTIIVFFSDNGGLFMPSSNYPFRGTKTTLWEGGVRVPAWAHAPGRIEPGEREGLIHVVDWFQTLLSLAQGTEEEGQEEEQEEDLGPRSDKIDGKNLWSFISQATPSPRKEVLLNIDPLSVCIYGFPPIGPNAAYIFKNWKLIEGDPGNIVLNCPLGDGFGPMNNPTTSKCPFPLNSEGYGLIDLEKDPGETTNVADENPAIMKSLIARLGVYKKQMVTPQYPLENSGAANPKNFNDVWYPWTVVQ